MIVGALMSASRLANVGFDDDLELATEIVRVVRPLKAQRHPREKFVCTFDGPGDREHHRFARPLPVRSNPEQGE